MTDERRAVLVGAVKECRSRDVLEEAFGFYGIANDVDTKIGVLVEAMGNPEIGFLGEPTSEDKYETLVCVYLSGTWQGNM